MNGNIYKSDLSILTDEIISLTELVELSYKKCENLEKFLESKKEVLFQKEKHLSKELELIEDEQSQFYSSQVQENLNELDTIEKTDNQIEIFNLIVIMQNRIEVKNKECESLETELLKRENNLTLQCSTLNQIQKEKVFTLFHSPDLQELTSGQAIQNLDFFSYINSIQNLKQNPTNNFHAEKIMDTLVQQFATELNKNNEPMLKNKTTPLRIMSTEVKQKQTIGGDAAKKTFKSRFFAESTHKSSLKAKLFNNKNKSLHN